MWFFGKRRLASTVVPAGSAPSSARCSEHLTDRAQQDLDVAPHRPVLDVEVVESGAVGNRRVTAQTVDLRPSGQPGRDSVTGRVPGDLAGELVDEERPLGPRTDQAHVSSD